LEELKALLGPPVQESTEPEGLLERIRLTYPGVEAALVRDSGRAKSPIVLWVTTGNEGVDIGRGRLVALRDRQDLERLDSFYGLEGVSLAALDLRNEAEELGVEGSPPQMRGPAVAGVAVGRTCGVAPRAAERDRRRTSGARLGLFRHQVAAVAGEIAPVDQQAAAGGGLEGEGDGARPGAPP
jgi:hypothetical protein